MTRPRPSFPPPPTLPRLLPLALAAALLPRTVLRRNLAGVLFLSAAALAASPGDGVTACFSNRSAVPRLSRCDASAVLPSVALARPAGAGVFSATFSGSLTPPSAGNYTFTVEVAGGVAHVRVDDHLLALCRAPAGAGAAVNCTARFVVPVPFYLSGDGSSALLVEFSATGGGVGPASLRLFAREEPGGADADVPLSWLGPALPPAYAAYLAAREAAEAGAGWGSHDSFDMLSAVRLPSGLAAVATLTAGNATLARLGASGPECSAKTFPARYGLHSAAADAGGARFYAEIEQLWFAGWTLRVEFASDADGGLAALATVVSAPQPPTEALWLNVTFAVPSTYFNRVCSGAADAARSRLVGACPGFEDTPLWPSVEDAGGAAWGAATLSLQVPPATGAAVAYSTGAAPASRAAVAAVVAAARAALVAEYAAYGDDNETAAGLAVAVSWNSVYAPHEGVYTPVFRGDPWGLGPFGVVMFLWDGYLTSLLATRVAGARWAAISNVVRMTRSGNAPGYVLGHWEGLCGEKNSKPPLGTLALRAVAAAFPADAAWLVPLLLEPLLQWNRWWWARRQFGGLIAPGGLGSPPPDYACASQGYDGLTSSKFETGLDNSPLFDAAAFDAGTSTMSQVDAGMSAMYAMDCAMLAELARAQGRGDWAAELSGRAAAVAAAMQAQLWQPAGDGSGRSLFFNRNFSVGAGGAVAFGDRVAVAAPPNLYPLLTGVPSLAQAEAVVAGFLANASEFCVNASARASGACGAAPSMPSVARSSPAFKDNDYWRGRSWAPMNFLVYEALAPYASASAPVAAARAELAAQSRAAFLANWVSARHVMENHNSESAAGCDVGNAMSFYSWGALDAWIALDARSEAGAA